jgi:hypothetical protein
MSTAENSSAIAWVRCTQLRNEEHFTFHSEIAALLGRTDAETTRAADLTPKHAARFAVLDKALQRIRKSPRTEELQKADKERDDAYRALRGFNKVMLLSDNAAIRAAASRIQIVIDTYKSVLGMNYEEETGTIYNLVEDLKSHKYAADASFIGLTPYVSKLETRNNLFKSQLSARDGETAAENGAEHVAVRDARLKLDNIYAKIRDRVNSYADEDAPNAERDAFVAELNVITKRFNILAGRHHKKGGKGEEGGES